MSVERKVKNRVDHCIQSVGSIMASGKLTDEQMRQVSDCCAILGNALAAIHLRFHPDDGKPAAAAPADQEAA